MESNDIQTVSNESGETTAVSETSHLLKSANMQQRLIEASQRTEGIPFEAALEKLSV